MKYTQHFVKQAHNRGITSTMITLVELFGYEYGDRMLLDRKQTQELLLEVNVLRKQLIKLCEKGGIALVRKNGQVITGFPITDRLGRVKQKYKKGS